MIWGGGSSYVVDLSVYHIEKNDTPKSKNILKSNDKVSSVYGNILLSLKN
jgi:hypothetical protein